MTPLRGANIARFAYDVLLDICRGIYETIRETLPSDTREGGAWLSGFAYAFVLHWAALLFVTYIHCSSRGTC